jgi:hypothetical protein
MLAPVLKAALILCVLLEGGWMAFDGGRALVVGDYVTPKAGQYAGQLGPWAKVVQALGIRPRGALMKGIFLVYGVLWLLVAAAFLFGVSWSWWGMLFLAAGALWYLPFGTLLSVVQLILLAVLRTQVGTT